MAYGANNGLQESDVTALINTQVGTANAQTVKTALNASGNAPIYTARAWVNFNGNSNQVQGATYVRTGFIVVINFGVVDPGLTSGDWIYFDSTSGGAADGLYQLSAVGMSGSDYTATFTHAASANTSGSCQTQKMAIRGSGNVSSIADSAVGVFYVNFSTDMPDGNYNITSHCGIFTASPYFVAANSTDEAVPRTASYCRVEVAYGNATTARTLYDAPYVDLTFYR